MRKVPLSIADRPLVLPPGVFDVYTGTMLMVAPDGVQDHSWWSTGLGWGANLPVEFFTWGGSNEVASDLRVYGGFQALGDP